MSELYRAIAGSPITYLAADISANQTTISIVDDSALPMSRYKSITNGDRHGWMLQKQK